MLRRKGRLVAPKHRTKLTQAQRDERSLSAAKEKLGNDKCLKLKKGWESLKNSTKSDKNFVMDGMIMNLAQLNLSNNMIRAIFGCGISRICRVRRVMDNPDLINLRRRTPSHAVSKEDLDALKEHLVTLDTEDSFPCAHRRPQKYFIESGLTWCKV